jgi:excisionase family DNA binding protein
LDQLVTRAEAATLLGVHVNTVDNYRRLGLLPTVKVRGLVRLRQQDIVEFVERHLSTRHPQAGTDVDVA